MSTHLVIKPELRCACDGECVDRLNLAYDNTRATPRARREAAAIRCVRRFAEGVAEERAREEVVAGPLRVTLGG